LYAHGNDKGRYDVDVPLSYRSMMLLLACLPANCARYVVSFTLAHSTQGMPTLSRVHTESMRVRFYVPRSNNRPANIGNCMPVHICKPDTSERIEDNNRHRVSKSHPIYRTNVCRSSSEVVLTTWSLALCACSSPCYISP